MPTDSIDWTPANTDVYASAGGLGDPEVVVVRRDGGSDEICQLGAVFMASRDLYRVIDIWKSVSHPGRQSSEALRDSGLWEVGRESRV